MTNIKITYPRIQTRLFIGLLLIILSFSISSIFYFRDIKELNKVTNDIVEHPFTVSNRVRDIDTYINAIHLSMKDVVLSENEIELNNAINLVNKNEQLIYDNFKIVKEKFLGDIEVVNDAYTTFVNWKPIRDEAIDLLTNGDIDAAAKITQEKGNDYIILLFQKTIKMIDFANEKAASFNQNSINILLQAKRNFLLFLISSSVLGIFLFLWIFFSISNPINNMINRIKNVSEDKIKGFTMIAGNQLAVLDYAISDFENREKYLEEKVDVRTNELREARNLLENSIDNAPIGIVEVGLDRKFNSANKSFCKTMGYSVKELKDLSFNDITVEEDKNIGKEFMKKALEGENSNIKFEKRYIHKSGKIVYASISSLLVHDINGKPLHFFSQISDISKQKVYEHELATHKNELESLIKDRTRELDGKTLNLSRSRQALTFLLEDVNDIKKQLEISNSKLQDANKELEAFSYSVSHDLKAPLRAVIGFSQILKEDFESQLDSESKRYINLIQDNAENMGTLINDLLNFSRMGRTELQKSQLDLHAIAQRVKSELEPSTQNRNISFKLKPMPFVNADEKLIYHAVLNLLSNAVKFTSKLENAIVEFGCISQNNENVFYIKDNGVGFNMKYAGKIFDVFQRLHTVEEFPGTGIGLSIVQRIIHKHEGKIWVESEKNKGTTFFFTI
jgi:PAS domain S-box-containing protein